MCIKAMQPKGFGIKALQRGKCHIEHRILDGGDFDEPCPQCGDLSLTREEEVHFGQETIQ